LEFHITFNAGLPPHGNPCIFLLWDGTLCEVHLQRDGDRLTLTTYNLAALCAPEKLCMAAGDDKIISYAELAGRGRVDR
jgi:hypothetical protein